jgi:hypothetical protein
MPTCIRLTDYKSSEEKEKGFFKPENRYEAKQDDFEKIPGSPIAYWVSDRVREIFEKSKKLGEIAEPRQGMATGDNNRFLRLWYEVEFFNIGFKFNELNHFHKSKLLYAPYNKGGDFKKWYGNQEYIIKFDKKNYDILSHMGNHLPSKQFYLKEGITYSFVSSSRFAVPVSQKSFL